MTTSNSITRLEHLQAVVTAAELATPERNEIAFDLWTQGITQREIASILNRVDRNSGGEGITLAMVQKMLSRMRAEREDELMASATG